MDAKVDIRKLQFLNDRIAQVTDALNQVRLSVHGLQQQPQLGFPQSPMGYQQPPFGLQQLPFGYQQPQFGFPQQSLYGGGPMGFQHSPYAGIPGMIPLGQQSLWQGGSQSPMGGGFGLQYAPYGPQAQQYLPQSLQGLGQAAWGGPASWFPFGGGLYHSPTELIEQRLGEQRANDPNRILQTFPLCLAPISTTPW